MKKHLVCLLLFTAGCGAPVPWRYDSLRNNYFAANRRSLVLVERHPHGLTDAAIRLQSDVRAFTFYGFLFSDIDGSPLVPIEATFTRKQDRLVVEHKLEGDRTVTAVVTLHPAGLVQFRFEGAQNIGSIAGGPLDTELQTIIFDYGWIFKRPGKFRRDRIMSDCLLGADAYRNHVLVACDNGKRLIVDPETRRYAWETRHRQKSATFIYGVADETAALMNRYKKVRNRSPAAHAKSLVGRCLLDDWSNLPFQRVIALIEALDFCNADRLVYVRHKWQRYGFDRKLPDTFPPNDAYGGLAGLERLSGRCGALGIPFGLHENFFDLHKDAPSYANFVAANQPREFSGGQLAPHVGRLRQSTGQPSLIHTPESALAAMRRNLGRQMVDLPVTAAFLDATSYEDPPSLAAGLGGVANRVDTLVSLRQLYSEAGKLVQGPVLGEGCTEKFIGAVDGANMDLWASDRWDNDPQAIEWQYCPALAWLAHDKVVLYGAGYRGRFRQPREIPVAPYLYEPAFADDYRSAAVYFGNAPTWQLTEEPYSHRLPDILREYFLGAAFHQHVGLVPIVKVVHPDENIHRAIVTYANDTVVHVNRSPEPWKVGDHVLGRFGYRVDHPEFVQRSVLEGGLMEMVRTKDLLYLDMHGQRRTLAGVTTSGRVAVQIMADRCEIVPIAGIETIEIDADHFMIPAGQIGRLTLTAPDGTGKKLDRAASKAIVISAEDLALPTAKDNPFAPRFRKAIIERIPVAPATKPAAPG